MKTINEKESNDQHNETSKGEEEKQRMYKKE